jgi:adenylate cyclase
MPRRRSDRDASSGLGESLKRAIARQMVEKFRDRPEIAAKLVEAGLIDPELAELDPDTVDDPVALLRDFGTSLAQRISERPSMLAELDLSALEVLGGESLGSLPPPAGAARRERSVVFTDLEGFTSFTEEEGDDAATDLLTDHYRAVGGLVRARGGTVVKRLGDGHLLSFPSPESAVLAGLEIVETEAGPLRLRAGAHAGEVMVSGGDLLGHVVNIASRVAGAATGGEALVTAAVWEPVQDLVGIRFESTPLRPLRGLEEPMELWRVERA